MPPLAVTIVLRLLCASAVSYLFWRAIGLAGVVASAPLFGVLLAKPIFELVAELRHSAKSLAFADVQGRHYEHRGYRLDILDDERHHRWISHKDLQRLMPSLPRAAVLRGQFPNGVRTDPALPGERILAEALLAYLQKSTDGQSLRFRNWLEREVVLPAAKQRERLGIRDDPPPPADESTQPS